MRVTSLFVASALGAFASFQTTVLARSLGSTELQNVLDDTDNAPEYHYPTDFTREIIPVPCHSHNDYWRDRPVYSAIAAGCVSIEADVWLINGTLYVGHHRSSLAETRTLKSLYIDQIVQILKRQNPQNKFVPSSTRNGVFDTNPAQTLYLFIDIKTDGVETWKQVSKDLQPLRDLGYLTKVKNGIKISAPVTVIGTGNTPLNLITELENRDYFYDAPLAELDQPELDNISSLISPIASTSFEAAVGATNQDKEDPLTSAQLETIRAQIKKAKSKGIGARYWQTPGWPIRRRNEIWRVLLKEGVALLNVDDLDAVKEYF
ncbi:uncharacterized protein CIMG_06608 [Coccidioides immitis RS]|uniref:Altered inheritance of mitochondria protein 6 n=4 Tax=Coccidioides immitis TaxID=5501 RepID=A0A0E1RW29_COCIM|nr:uncharacterized protein CIMG_06608 [Coccidioides immitis RS]KMP03738.1 hypothetical protein CIRG_03430 [Coccidioides immitis RMSCC 2394]KMU74709.1 hypothetical protein CISG_00639 [Coccidioides immitis RMSCC 3703]KMU83239.1 hypothetical protein CIHG_01021 [Coccidioides immitis H538.4]TPX23980.1 hypothetical protein DIZ76_013323 [Coccidioides immitis]EAS31129.1 hypothetical protein CIMG_06608 [Coccidioides immitis RS]